MQIHKNTNTQIHKCTNTNTQIQNWKEISLCTNEVPFQSNSHTHKLWATICKNTNTNTQIQNWKEMTIAVQLRHLSNSMHTSLPPQTRQPQLQMQIKTQIQIHSQKNFWHILTCRPAQWNWPRQREIAFAGAPFCSLEFTSGPVKN